MKHLLSVAIIILCVVSLSSLTLEERIQRYSGENATGLLNLLQTQSGDTLRYARFLLENSSDIDLAVLSRDFLLQNIRLATKAHNLPWAKDVPEEEFLHFVLPARVSQEPFSNWREPFYNELSEKLAGVTDIREAITLVNIWCAGQMRFEPTNGRDQTPLTTIRRGYGRCEEMMILFIAAARSVGIPARAASAPFWSFTDNNHAWTEVWTQNGWTFLGAAEPANKLAEAWFTRATQRAPFVTAEAFGNYQCPQTLSVEHNVTQLSTTNIYAPTHTHVFHVTDEAGQPVAEAQAVFYAVTYGGLFPLLDLKTDDVGNLTVPLGYADCPYSFSADNLFAFGQLDGFNDTEETVVLRPLGDINETFEVHFLTSEETVLPESEERILPDFDLRKRSAENERDKRLAEQRHTRDFLRFFALQPEDNESNEAYQSRRDAWLKQCERLAGAAQDWLHVLEATQTDPTRLDVLRMMLADWDIKELVELPDSAAIANRAQILVDGRARWALADSLWREHVLALPFPRVSSPEDGWALPFYQRVLPLLGNDLASTTANVQAWVKQSMATDTTVVYTYFSGSLNPMQWLNMHNTMASGERIVLAYALNVLGVPTRWRGFLEYYDGSQWVELGEHEEEGPVERTERTLAVRLEVDGKPVSPKSFENFLMGSVEEGMLSYVWFDEQADSLVSHLTWPQEQEKNYMLEAAVRNDNGDACIVLQTLPADADSIVLRLWTPERRNPAPAPELDQTALAARKLGGNQHGWKLVYVLGREETEPQQRMMEGLRGILPQLNAKGADVVIWVEGRRTVTADGARVLYGRQVSKEDLVSSAYPLVFLFDPSGKLVYRTSGYNLSVPGLIVRMIQ